MYVPPSQFRTIPKCVNYFHMRTFQFTTKQLSVGHYSINMCDPPSQLQTIPRRVDRIHMHMYHFIQNLKNQLQLKNGQVLDTVVLPRVSFFHSSGGYLDGRLLSYVCIALYSMMAKCEILQYHCVCPSIIASDNPNTCQPLPYAYVSLH